MKWIKSPQQIPLLNKRGNLPIKFWYFTTFRSSESLKWGFFLSSNGDKTFTIQKPKFPDLVRYTLRTKHYSKKTEKAYVNWTREYILHYNKHHPKEMNKIEVKKVRHPAVGVVRLRHKVLPGLSEGSEASCKRTEAHYLASPLALGMNIGLCGTTIIQEQQPGKQDKYVLFVICRGINKTNDNIQW